MKSKALWVGLLAVGLADWLLLNVVVGPAYLASAEATVPSPSTAEFAAMVPPLAQKDEPTPPSTAPPVEPNRPVAAAGDTPPVSAGADSAPDEPPSAAVGNPPDRPAPSADPSPAPNTVDVDAKPTAEGAVAPSTEPVLFTRQSAELGEDARRSLKTLSKHLLENPNAILVIEGHADKRGKDEFNEWLSLQRARAVRAYLHGLGVRTEQMRVEARGSNDPVDKSGSEAARAKNRRVELIVK